MRKWIRWWGITVFIILILLTLGIWYLLADRIIENNIEEVGEFIIGAKVDVGKTDLASLPDKFLDDRCADSIGTTGDEDRSIGQRWVGRIGGGRGIGVGSVHVVLREGVLLK